MAEIPTWAELLTLMLHGPDPTLRGRIRHDDGGEPTYFGYALGTDDVGPVVAGGDDDVLAWRDGARLRLEKPDGTVTLICDGETVWSFRGADGIAREARPRHVVYGVGGTDLLDRGSAERWLGDDFTRPTGPVTATSFLGRPAWAVELAPPRRKPHPLQVVVDAGTGLLLQQRNDGFGTVSEWTDLVVGEDLDPGLFTWDGPVVTEAEQVAQRHREEEADERESRDLTLAQLGVTSVTLPVGLGVHVQDLEPDGTLHASIDPVGTLRRRPRSDERWGHLDDGARLWSDDTWDWALTASGEVGVTDATVADLRRQLGSPPPPPGG